MVNSFLALSQLYFAAVATGSGVAASCFHMSLDYIIARYRAAHHLGRTCDLLPYGIVVEPSPVRGLAAGCPIQTIFAQSRSAMFHAHAVVRLALRVFQQFNALQLRVTTQRDYC